MHRNRSFLTLFLGVALIAFVGLMPLARAAETTNAFAKWEKEIAAFESADKTNPPPKDANLFVGSSSIRLWKTLVEDFPGHKVINRGFGGSQIVDSTYFANRIVFPYKPAKIFIYAGDNDLAAGKSAATVAADFKEFVKMVRTKLPRVPIVYISIKPSPSRAKLIPAGREANTLISEFASKSRNVSVADVGTVLLGADGQPDPDLFQPDKLHLNPKGYALWRKIIEPMLQ